MATAGAFFVLLALVAASQALSSTDVLSKLDQERLKTLFTDASPYQNLATAFYSIEGLKALGAPLPTPKADICKYLQDGMVDTELDTIYFAFTAGKSMGCKIAPGKTDETLSNGVSSPSAVLDLFFALTTLDAQGSKYDTAEVVKSLDAALKKDDSILGTSLALHIASLLPKEVKVDKYFELVEDIVAQADTIDEKYLQFETLQQASAFITGAYKLATRVNKKPLITEEQVVQLANYILTRKSTQTIRNAFFVLQAIKTLTENSFQVPVAFTLSGSMAVSSADPSVTVKVSDLMGGSLGPMTLKSDAVISEDAGTKKEISTTTTSKSENFEVNLIQSKPDPGFYDLSLKATPLKPSSKLIGLSDGKLTVKVTTEVSVEKLEISIVDRDQSITAKTVKVKFPEKLKTVLEADHLQNIVIKFTLTNKAGESMDAHQTFIRIVNVESKQEVIFTAEADTSDTYKFTLDVADSGREFFNQQSGKYTLQLIVGDAVIQNPISWTLTDITLKFPDQAEAAPSPKHNQYNKQPDIEHLFRIPEKRPPVAVSTAFTFLVLAPLLLLFILWIKLGVNIKNFSFSLGSLGFHGGLGAILALFYCYWAYLNMFVTLKYLTLLGVVTFVCGHRLLSSIANKKN